MMRSARQILQVVGIALGGLGLLASCGTRPAVPPPAPLAVLKADVPGAVELGYVGWSVCAECHARRVEEFQATRHFQALKFPDEAELPAGFHAGGNSFQPPGSPLRFAMRSTPEPAMLAQPVAAQGAGETHSPLAFIYGSGAGTDEVYFTRRGEELFELPVVWLHPQNCWGTAQFDPHGTGDLSRPLAPQCLECHAVWVDYQRGSANRYGPFDRQLTGVSCERCHGPAKEHVAHHRAHPDDKAPAAIIQPKLLSRERLMDLCAQCHTNTVRHRRPPFSYRPGEPLVESYLVLEMQYPEQDRVANQVRYLRDSRCYQRSETMTCITCHDPHRPRPADELQSSRASCLTCHQPDHCVARPALPAAVQDRCVACHMPRRNKVQVHFETERGEIAFPAPRWEHRIGVYPEAMQEVLFDWQRAQPGDEAKAAVAELSTALHAHWHHVGDAARDEQRFLIAIDAYRTALKFDDSAEVQSALDDVVLQRQEAKRFWFDGEAQKRKGKLSEATASFQALLELQPHHAAAHYELGTLYAAADQLAEAQQHLRLSQEYDANDPGPEVMLGWLDYLAGKPADALEHYVKAQAIEPWNDRIDYMIGQCHAGRNEWDRAAKAYQKTMTINPNHAEAARALRRILRERYTAAVAVPLAEAAVQETSGQQLDLLLTLAEIYQDLDRTDDARQVVAAGLKIASEPKNQELLPQFRSLERRLDRGENGVRPK